MADPAAQVDFTQAEIWSHSDHDDASGFRVISSMDQPETVVLQVKHDGEVISLRLGIAALTEMHRQAVSRG